MLTGVQFDIVGAGDEVGVWTDGVGELHQFGNLGCCPARHGRGQHRYDGEADIVLAVGKAHIRLYFGTFGQLLSELLRGAVMAPRKHAA